jgi:hypothetical protein
MGCNSNNKALKDAEDDRTDKLDKARKKATELISAKKQHLDNLLKNRQPAINPYAGMTNQMANLGVATQAAEFQAEQTDIALANTLDTIAATGGGAGGATALAQAALQSKKSIAASLEQQEASNQKLAAQGAQQLQTQIAEGEKFKFNTTENRQNADIDRAATVLDNTEQRALENLNAINTSFINEEMS